MELLFKQLKQRFPLRYFYGKNVPEGVSSDSNIIVPLRSTLSSPIRWVICTTIPTGSYARTYVVVALDKMAEEMHKGILYE